MPFPWADDDGLAPVLDDPELWATVFEHHGLRKLLKAVAKSTLKDTLRREFGASISVEDDNLIGRLAVRLMRRTRDRRTLATALERKKSQTSFILFAGHRIAGRAESQLNGPRTPESPGGEGLPAGGHVDLWRTWLKGRGLLEEQLRPVALLAAGQAMVSPGKHDNLLCALIHHDPRFRSLLLPEGAKLVGDVAGEETPAIAAASADKPSGPHVSTQHEVDAVAPAQASRGAEIEVIAGEIAAAREQARALIPELREALARLEANEEPPAQALCARLDSLAVSIERLRAALRTTVTHALDIGRQVDQASGLRALAEIAAEVLASRSQREEETARARTLLLRVSLLAHTRPEAEAILDQPRAQARELLERVHTVSETELAELVRQAHPLTALLRLVEDKSRPDDACELVQRQFGGPLLYAVMRDEISVREGSTAHARGGSFQAPGVSLARRQADDAAPTSSRESPRAAAPVRTETGAAPGLLPTVEPPASSITIEEPETGTTQAPGGSREVAQVGPLLPPAPPPAPSQDTTISASPGVPSGERVAPEAKSTDAPLTASESRQEDRKQVGPSQVERARPPSPPVAPPPPPGRYADRAGAGQPAAVGRCASATSGPDEMTELLWNLLQVGRFAEAYHLARHLEAVATGHGGPSAALIGALILGATVRSSVGETTQACSRFMTEIVAELSSAGPQIHNLAVASSLRPALLSPGTRAHEVLRLVKLDPELHPVDLIARATLEMAQKGQVLTPEALKGVRRREVWDRQLQDIRNSIRQWLAEARQKKIIYAPTTDVWRAWLAPDGHLGRIFEIAVQDRRSEKESLEGELRNWCNEATIEKRLATTDKEIRGEIARLRPITARAVNSIVTKAGEAGEVLRRWLDHLSSQPPPGREFITQTLEKGRSTILQSIEPARLALHTLRSAKEDKTLSITLEAIERSLDDLRKLLDPEHPEVAPHPPRYYLCADLLRLDAVALNDDWEPAADDPSIIRAISDWRDGLPEWTDAFDRRLAGKDFDGAGRILKVAEEGFLRLQDLGNLQERFDCATQETGKKIAEELPAVRKAVERAFSDAVLPYEEYQAHTARLEGVRSEEHTSLRPSLRVLEEIRRDLQRRRDEEGEKASSRLQALNLHQDDPTYVRILERIKQGDIRTADEFFVLLKQGQPLPEYPAEVEGGPFFPEFLQDFMKQGIALNRASCAIVRERKQLGSLAFAGLPEDQAREMSEVLEAWLRLRTDPAPAPRDVKRVVEGLGFDRVDVYPQLGARQGSTHEAFKMKLAHPTDPHVCPIPRFGSETSGHWGAVVLHKQPLENDIVDATRVEASETPVLAVFRGVMDETRRRRLAHACRAARRPILVLDDALILHLCRLPERRSRLAAFFRAATPFSYANPYTTTAGYVPVEMFYGRRQELERLVERNNSHLVYGGRQLGKTALLRQIERLHHCPAEGRIVKYLDLENQAQIGITRPVADIWAVIASSLRDSEVVKPGVQRPETIREQVKEWLDADPRRRIVLLLDEADRFLKSDSRGGDGSGGAPWPLMRQLKALSDTTERRFKFVFAGLHDVQRSSRDPNSPIAHLGEPICVGPFLTREEIREAREMITRPLEALGFRFENDDLVMRILAYTNYYPSLIQLFCKHLLEHLGRATFPPTNTPPYRITEKHVEDAYQARSLREGIVERFNWTLNLDRRYRVLALHIALEARSEPEVLQEGIGLNRIRDAVMASWPQGFAEDSGIDVFRVLLDEMKGLGVLREVRQGHYTLRSPNVLKLLPNEDQILDALMDAQSKEPETVYEAAAFRRAHPGRHWQLSPLTAQQESELTTFDAPRITVVWGCRASGIDEVQAYLQAAVQEAPQFAISPLPETVTDREAFASALRHQFEQRAEAPTILVVPRTKRWDHLWVEKAKEVTQNRRKALAVVFLGDPAIAWAWLRQPPGSALDITEVTEIPLKLWSRSGLDRWLGLLGVPVTQEHQSRVRAITGGWHHLCQELGRRTHDAVDQWEDQLALLDQDLQSDPKWLESFELPPDAMAALQVLAQLGGTEIAGEDLDAGLDPAFADPSFVESLLYLADRFCYSEPRGDRRLSMNSALGRLLGGRGSR